MNTTTEQIHQLDIDLIELNGGTQSRAEINESTVVDYAEAMESGDSFPPIIVYFDGDKYHLADGFHRVRARLLATELEGNTIDAIIYQGTRRDAVLFSVGANSTHGLPRTNADKRRAVETLLRDEEWCQWSDREIARQCGVGNKYVGDVRRSICVQNTDNSRKVNRNGTTYTQNAANIGRNAQSEVTGDTDSQSEDEEFEETTQLNHNDEPIHLKPTDVEDSPGASPGSVIAASVESILPEILADEYKPNLQLPTPAEWQAIQQELKTAQEEIERITKSRNECEKQLRIACYRREEMVTVPPGIRDKVLKIIVDYERELSAKEKEANLSNSQHPQLSYLEEDSISVVGNEFD